RGGRGAWRPRSGGACSARAVSRARPTDRATIRGQLRRAPAGRSRAMIRARWIAAAAGIVLCAGCAAWNPMRNTPPSSSRPWAPPGLPRDWADLVERERARGPEVSIDPEKTYERRELIDIAQRTNPETRVAWEKARQAAIAVGLAEGTYYPLLAATATGGAAPLALPFPPNLIPGGLPKGDLTANTQFALPLVSPEWWLLDFGRRASTVESAKALKLEATVGFNGKHQQVVFAVTRTFYGLTAVRGRVAAARAALEAAQTLETAAQARLTHGEGTVPEALQAHEGAGGTQYDLG